MFVAFALKKNAYVTYELVRDGRRPTASERRGNNLKRFKGFNLKAKARIRPYG